MHPFSQSSLVLPQRTRIDAMATVAGCEDLSGRMESLGTTLPLGEEGRETAGRSLWAVRGFCH